MTDREAVRVLEKRIADMYISADPLKTAMKIAVRVMKHHLKQVDIGFTDDVIENYKKFEDELIAQCFTFNSVIEAMDKQIPMKPHIRVNDFIMCAKCDSIIRKTDNYCRNCGQRLDWSDEE